MARVDSCFKSQRPLQDCGNDKTYWYDLKKNRDMDFKNRLDWDSVQYTSTRVKIVILTQHFMVNQIEQLYEEI